MPRALSRSAIHAGDGSTFTPSITRAWKRPHRSGSRISTDTRAAASPGQDLDPGLGDGERETQPGGQVSGHAGHRHGVGTVRVDLEVVEDVGGDAEGLGDRGADGRPAPPSAGVRIRMPAWSSPRPSSRDEHNMPFDHSPRSLRRAISRPPGITVPSVARGTRSPTAMLNAPQQICSGSPSPVSTSTSWILSALGCGRRASTRTTTMPSRPSPIRSTDSTAMPRSLMASPRPTGSSSGKGANSRSQERRTFMPGTAPGSGRRPCTSRGCRRRRGA